MTLLRLACGIAASIGIACRAPAPPEPPRASEPRCATDFDGPAPAVLRLATRADALAELARAQPQAASDVARQLDEGRAAQLVDAMAGTEHGGDGYYDRVSAVFHVADGFVVAKDLAQWFHTLPPSAEGAPAQTLTERSSVEILGTIGHVRIASQPAIHHFVDLASGTYLRGFVEGPHRLAHWTIEPEGASADGCTVYWR